VADEETDFDYVIVGAGSVLAGFINGVRVNFLSMNHKLRILALLCAVAVPSWAAGVKTNDPFPELTVGTLPPSSVKNWIRLDNIGPENAPVPIVWISSSRFRRVNPDMLVVLPRHEFESLVTFVRSNQCSTVLDKPPGWGTLGVTEFSDGKLKPLCIMPCDKAHDYLPKILALSSINWTERKARPIRLLTISLACSPY
jgi:hypothetical protein